MAVARILRHLCSDRGQVRRVLPATAMKAIEAAIGQSEATHQGELRFAVEAGLDLMPLFKHQTARNRALEVFSALGVWDTEHNNGVLIYLLLADREVEIIADRGIHARVGGAGWELICHEMEKQFHEGRFEEGILAGIQSISCHLRNHYPKTGPAGNELPNAPVVL